MKTFRQRKSQLGQGMTEYIIIVALVGIGAIAVYKSFGQTVNATTAAAADALSGTSATGSHTNAVNAANAANSAGATAKTMATFQTN